MSAAFVPGSMNGDLWPAQVYGRLAARLAAPVATPLAAASAHAPGRRLPHPGPAGALLPLAAAALAAAAPAGRRRCGRARRRDQPGPRVACRGYVTGPGWTDELARIFDPREEGPAWERCFGYRGRPTIRLLLDGEDLVHSYAQAEHLRTGRWTGPLSAGVEEALSYGAWRGGAPEDPNPNRDPEAPRMFPPEILTFVAMPADLIEAITPNAVCDGYPKETRQEIGRCQFSRDGFFINEFLRSLQDDARLITWNRPGRLPGGAPRPNALLTQKYFQQGRPLEFRWIRAPPIMLAQVMGAGLTLKVGEKVEALKSGRMLKDKWLPSTWKQAEVVAVNYDGTYDLQFTMGFGPVRERRKEFKNLRGTPTLSLNKNEVYKDFGADAMPAKFRLMQELNYAQAVPASRIRLPGALDRISETLDTDANQDWYICSSRRFLMTASRQKADQDRLQDFVQRFQLGYRWVPTAKGLRFEPVPNPVMAVALRANHKQVAQEFAEAANADEEARRKLEAYKAGMSELGSKVTMVPGVEPDRPSRPAGPLRDAKRSLSEAEKVAVPALPPRRSLAQELAADVGRR